MFYTIQNEKTNSHRTFAICEDTYREGKIITKVTRRPNPDVSKCCCDFVGIPDCPVHFHKPFARMDGREIIVFHKLMADVNEKGQNEWLQTAKILEKFWNGYPAEAGYPRGYTLHEGSLLVMYESVPCSRCGEQLTNPESIKKGIGPVCEANME